MKTIEIHQIPPPLSLGAAVLRSSFGKTQDASKWPELTYVRPHVVIQERTVRRYAKLCGSPPEQGVPILLPHIEAFPLAMIMFASKLFPYRAIGMIHLANKVTLHQRIEIGDALRIEVQTGDLMAHEKGQAMTLYVRALRDDVLVWSSVWTFLRTHISNPSGPGYVTSLPTDLPLSRQADIATSLKTTRRYAAVSGDFNPIHLSHLSSKLMGFQRAIAHGMWTKARALTLLMPMTEVDRCEVNVEFKSPLRLPEVAAFWSRRSKADAQFEVKNARGDRTHLRGELTLPNVGGAS